MKILVTGSSGQIGTHLCMKLEREGHEVHGVDIEFPIYHKPTVFHNIDCRKQLPMEMLFDCYNYDIIYLLSARMGGIGIIQDEKWVYDIMIGSTQQIANILDGAIKTGVKKVFYASSACVYPEDLQMTDAEVQLKEMDAWRGKPDLIYGVQKLCGEEMMLAAHLTHGLDIRIARFHNIFGTLIDYKSEKTKAPAALSFKTASAKNGDEIEVWGTGDAKRSFLYIDECLEGVERLMNSDYKKPLNIGSDKSIRINDLAQMIIDISGKDLKIKNVPGNVGVQSRNSNNDLCERVLGWKPSMPLSITMRALYQWIYKEIHNTTVGICG